MIYWLLVAPIVGILSALGAVVAEQLLAVAVSIFFQKEIILDAYKHLNFFLIAAAVIEEIFKYFAAAHILQKIFNLRKLQLIFASTAVGLFFGLTEIYFILLANGRRIEDFQALGNQTLFSLAIVIVLHALTALTIGSLLAAQAPIAKFKLFTVLIPPTLIHLLINFLIIRGGASMDWLIVAMLGATFVANIAFIAYNFRRLAWPHNFN